MENYKKKSLNFSNVDKRELRAYRRSIDRRNVKHARLSALRGIDENHVESSLTEERVEVKNVPQKVPDKKTDAKTKIANLKTNQRAEMLKKWKEEKELKRKLELKKPAFVVKHITYKPPPSLIPKNPDGKKDESKIARTLGTSRIAPPKTGNLQNTSCLPRSQMSTLAFPQSSVTKASFKQVSSKLPQSKPAMNRTLASIPKPSFKPQNQASQQHTVNTKKGLPAPKSAIADVNKTCISSHSNVANKKPVFNKPQAVSKPQVSSLKPSFIGKPAAFKPLVMKNSPATQPAKAKIPENSKQKNQASSFAPRNYMFKPPISLEKFIFPNGIPSFSSNLGSVKRNEGSSVVVSESQKHMQSTVHNASEKMNTSSLLEKNSGGDMNIEEHSTLSCESDVAFNTANFEKTATKAEVLQHECTEPVVGNAIEAKEQQELPDQKTEDEHSEHADEISDSDLPNQRAEDERSEHADKISDSDLPNQRAEDEHSEHADEISNSDYDATLPSTTQFTLEVPQMKDACCTEQTEILDGNVCDEKISVDLSGPEKVSLSQEVEESSESGDKTFTPIKIVESAEKEKENKSPNMESQSPKDTIKLSTLTSDDRKSNVEAQLQLGAGRLHTIIEELDICEDVVSTGKKQNRYASQTVLTPRRSRRLASLHEKMNAHMAKEDKKTEMSLLDGPNNEAMEKQPSLPTHEDLAEEMSSLSVKGTLDCQMGNGVLKQEGKKPVLPVLNGNSGLTPVSARKSRKSVKKEIAENHVGHDSLEQRSNDAFTTPNRPMTRQQRKISLLGSPQMPSNMPRKSIRGDLITFSPGS